MPEPGDGAPAQPRGFAAPAVRSLYVALDTIQNPLNVGAAVRVAAATGAALCFTGFSLPHTSRKAKAGAVGLEARVPISYQPDLSLLAAEWRAAGYRLVGTSPHGGQRYSEYDLTRPFVLVLGNEVSGLSRAKLSLLDDRIYIPMEPGVESLNVTVAMAILLYEALRQRR